MMVGILVAVLFLMKKIPLLCLLQMKLKAVEEQQEKSDFDLEVEYEYEGMFLSSLESVNDHKINLMKFPLLVKNNASVPADQETRMTKSDFQYLAKNSLDWRLTVYK